MKGRMVATAVLTASLVSACGSGGSPGIAVVINGVADDRSFNEYTLAGVRSAAERAGLEVRLYTGSDREPESFAAAMTDAVGQGHELIVAVGFPTMGATATAASAHPDRRFVSMDYSYDDYAALPNVTSLVFAEDQAGYLAGVLAGCVSPRAVVAAVGGARIPTVQRYLGGFEHGARAAHPGITVLTAYADTFTDAQAGYEIGAGLLAQGADVLFAAAGLTGTGAIHAAFDARAAAVGVDVDQYFTLTQYRSALLTSATKGVDTAAFDAVESWLEGRLPAGVRRYDLRDQGVGLAPFHDLEGSVSAECRQQVAEARAGLIAGTVTTGSGN